MFSAEGIVVEAAALFVAKAEVCGAPFVALVGYSEKHINKVGKFGDGMEPRPMGCQEAEEPMP